MSDLFLAMGLVPAGERTGLSESRFAPSAGPQGAQLARFCGFDLDLRPLVRIGTGDPQPAITAIALDEQAPDQPVLVLFEHGGDGRPIVVALVPPQGLPDPPVRAESPATRPDGERLVLHAEREIELRCGEASIVLTRAGKVLIRGTHVVSRSKGANKIKGAYVDIN